MLTARAANPVTGDRVALQVAHADGEPVIDVLNLTDELVNRFVKDRAEELRTPLRSPDQESPPHRVSDLAEELLRTTSAVQRAAGWQPEDRTPDQYEEELTKYSLELRQKVVPAAVSRAIKAGRSIIRFRVTKPDRVKLPRRGGLVAC